MIKLVIENITNKNLFYYLFIIFTTIFIIKKLNITLSHIIYITLILISIYLYNVYILENKKDIIQENKNIKINLDPIEYNNLYIIIKKLEEISIYNIFVYNEILKYIKMFFQQSNNNFKIILKKEILNNLSSLIITLPLHLDYKLELIMEQMEIELDKYITPSKTNLVDLKQFNKNYDNY